MSALASEHLTWDSAVLLLFASMVSIAAGVTCGVLLGPKDNRSTSALLGGALTAVATIPGLLLGFIVGLWQ